MMYAMEMVKENVMVIVMVVTNASVMLEEVVVIKYAHHSTG